jgi:hypothetical protein
MDASKRALPSVSKTLKICPLFTQFTNELHAYLVHLRQKCQTTIAELSDEKAHKPVDYPWTLGQNASAGASDWASRAKADEGV